MTTSSCFLAAWFVVLCLAALANEYSTKRYLVCVALRGEGVAGRNHTAQPQRPPSQLPRGPLHSFSSLLHPRLLSIPSFKSVSLFFQSNFFFPLKLWQQSASRSWAQFPAQTLIKLHAKQFIQLEKIPVPNVTLRTGFKPLLCYF